MTSQYQPTTINIIQPNPSTIQYNALINIQKSWGDHQEVELGKCTKPKIKMGNVLNLSLTFLDCGIFVVSAMSVAGLHW